MQRKPARKPAQLRAQTTARKTSRTKTFRDKTSRNGTSRVKSAQRSSTRKKVKAYRERMRKRGMKLIQIWVPDPKSPYFLAEARRQARLIAESPHEKEDQAFIDSITDWNWE
jgi:antidote-toxin recognition MazE-like antitoxin